MVVAVALGRHRPELADDRNLGLRTKTIDFDRLQVPAAPPERAQDALVLLERLADLPLHLGDRAIGRALFHLVGANAVAQDVDDVACEKPTGERHEELWVEHEPDFFAGSLLEARLLLEEHDAEAVEACVAERLSILGHVHAETAGTASAGRQKDVVVDDVFQGSCPPRREVGRAL